MKYDVFISCKSEDYKFARQIYNFLTGPELNYKVFLADAELHKKGKTFYGKVIDAALEASDHLILFASKVEYVTTEYVENEWRLFLEELRSGRKKGNIVTILKGVDTKSLPISLRHIQSIPFNDYQSVIDFLPKFEEGDEASGHRESDDETDELTPPTPPTPPIPPIPPIPPTPSTPSLKKWLWMAAILLLIVGGIFGGGAIIDSIDDDPVIIIDSIESAQIHSDSLDLPVEAQAEPMPTAVVKDSTDKIKTPVKTVKDDHLANVETAETKRLPEENVAPKKKNVEPVVEKAPEEKEDKAVKEQVEPIACTDNANPAAETDEEDPQQAAARASKGTINGHEWVDLGLSVKWATCNVGASSPSEYGNYYAWGETRTKSEYNFSNSVTYNKSMGDIAGNPNYDAARANWGGSWRLPTKAEFEELKNNCTWSWTSQGGHNGYKVTGKNGNSIFLPAAGRKSEKRCVRKIGRYWTSSPHDSGAALEAYNLRFNSSGYEVYWYQRKDGFSVRPVISDEDAGYYPPKTYKVGDYYNVNGKEGVVFYVDASGRHGKIVSMIEPPSSYKAWKPRVLANEQIHLEDGASSKTNGATNMRAVVQRPNWSNNYPAFDWCARLGVGWYLPAIEELKQFTLNGYVRDAVNSTLEAKGGTKLSDSGGYWSSTEELDNGYFLVWCVGVSSGSSFKNFKGDSWRVRAVSAF